MEVTLVYRNNEGRRHSNPPAKEYRHQIDIHTRRVTVCVVEATTQQPGTKERQQRSQRSGYSSTGTNDIVPDRIYCTEAQLSEPLTMPQTAHTFTRTTHHGRHREHPALLQSLRLHRQFGDEHCITLGARLPREIQLSVGRVHS